jgi:hypothetical protein
MVQWYFPPLVFPGLSLTAVASTRARENCQKFKMINKKFYRFWTSNKINSSWKETEALFSHLSTFFIRGEVAHLTLWCLYILIERH